MRRRSARVAQLWLSFWAASALSWIAYYWLPDAHSYTLMLISAIANVFLGLWIIFLENRALRIIIAVIVGLVVGQWWMIVWSIVFLIWHVRGFAP